MKTKRNLKLLNHWIAELRAYSAKRWKEYYDEDEDPRVYRRVTKQMIRDCFAKAIMEDYFKEGLTPSEAFHEEVSNWE